jgi:hypothetical protein
MDLFCVRFCADAPTEFVRFGVGKREGAFKEKSNFRGLDHETVEEFLRRGGFIEKVHSSILRDAIKKMREQLRGNLKKRWGKLGR